MADGRPESRTPMWRQSPAAVDAPAPSASRSNEDDGDGTANNARNIGAMRQTQIKLNERLKMITG